MENMQPEISPTETRIENKAETALVWKKECSMKNGGGGRYQLLTAGTRSFAGVPASSNVPGPSSTTDER